MVKRRMGIQKVSRLTQKKGGSSKEDGRAVQDCTAEFADYRDEPQPTEQYGRGNRAEKKETSRFQ